MQKRLNDVLQQKGENYILPFYWLRGENKELLCGGMEKIKESGIGAVCVESRPHPDFVGELWWRDMDIILDKAKELDMKVWIFDDVHFPTGGCAKQITKTSPYRTWLLTHYCIDVVGPLNKHGFIVRLEENEGFVGAVAARRDKSRDYFIDELVDISEGFCDDVVEWDIPEGRWTITIIKTTYTHTSRPNYANLIDKDATKFLIDTVYEAHYKQYADEFGKTISGFFSDEPQFANVWRDIADPYGAYIGARSIPLPWCTELASKLQKRWGDKYCCNLAVLWSDADKNPEKTNVTGKIRKDYMEELTHLYEKNFCGQIGDWCRAHGVEYIGHIIEEGRLGMGVGHFFRGLWGQDMSGIDVVLQSVRPEMEETNFYRMDGKSVWSPLFPHFGLGKIGASLAHIDSKKKGRALCEVFGAYGWAEGLKLMKWLADHMLVRGINYFVPHAFSLKEFPDLDCPPHFYARGNNPQFPYFKLLMQYMNRVSHLINGGLHCSNVGVLYSADLEWTERTNMQFSQVTKPLMQHQIDFDIVPIDHVVLCDFDEGVLLSGAPVYAGEQYIGREKMKVLIIPECRCFDRAFANWCINSIEKGFRIICINSLPTIMEDDGTLNKWTQSTPEIIALNDLATALESINEDFCVKSPDKYLRHYHYKHLDGEYHLFFNEGLSKVISTDIVLNTDENKKVVQFDAWDNRLIDLPWNEKTKTLELLLQPYEMKIVYVSKLDEKIESLPLIQVGETKIISPKWEVSLKYANKSYFEFVTTLETLENITSKNMYKDFCGVIKYETEIMLENIEQITYLNFGEVYETAELWVNGVSAGSKIVPPYQFEVSDLLKVGTNKIELKVANTVVHMCKDNRSANMPLEPSGLLGPVSIVLKK